MGCQLECLPLPCVRESDTAAQYVGSGISNRTRHLSRTAACRAQEGETNPLIACCAGGDDSGGYLDGAFDRRRSSIAGNLAFKQNAMADLGVEIAAPGFLSSTDIDPLELDADAERGRRLFFRWWR